MKVKDSNGNIILEKEVTHVTHAIICPHSSLHVRSDVRDRLSDYYAKKAEDAIDRLWDEGKITHKTIEKWKYEHMRTLYK